MPRGRTIRIYLSTGEVTGIRHGELVNWTGQAIACPRSRMDELKGWPEAQRPGVYFLVGADAASDRDVYIGESENVLLRLRDHLLKRDFWQEVVLFTSKDANVTKAHVKYLEHRLHRLATEIGRCRLLNTQPPAEPSLPRADADAMEEYLDNLRVLLGALGHRFLVPLAVVPTSVVTDPAVLRYVVRGVEARGTVTDEGFVVLRGSAALPESKPAMGAGNLARKGELRAAGKLVDDGDHLRFTEDILFETPSQAAVMVYGNATNGRIAWKDGAGRTLKDIEAASLAGSVPALAVGDGDALR